jgi:acetamidase/formamidase
MAILQSGEGPIDGEHYVVSSPETIQWGWLPNRDAAPVLTVASGSTVTVDTVSHEGVLEDQGRDPVAWFGQYGIGANGVLHDARQLAESDLEHSIYDDGPHVVTGPIRVNGAQPGDLLEVQVLSLLERVPYGCISNRHGFGALPGEMPEGPGPEADASTAEYKRFGAVCHFSNVVDHGGRRVGTLPFGSSVARFPLAPFLGIMAVAPDTSEPVHSTPPGPHGGNMDVNELIVGSRLYLPVQVAGGLFSVGDPHYAQGDGEVCLTALEAPLRATLRLSVLSSPDARHLAAVLGHPFIETDTHWIPIGLHEDLNEAMARAVRAAIDFLVARFAVDRSIAYAYLSAAGDFEVSQVVDKVKGVHCLIRKSDFSV